MPYYTWPCYASSDTTLFEKATWILIWHHCYMVKPTENTKISYYSQQFMVNSYILVSESLEPTMNKIRWVIIKHAFLILHKPGNVKHTSRCRIHYNSCNIFVGNIIIAKFNGCQYTYLHLEFVKYKGQQYKWFYSNL